MAFWSRKTAEPVQTQTILDFLNIGTVELMNADLTETAANLLYEIDKLKLGVTGA